MFVTNMSETPHDKRSNIHGKDRARHIIYIHKIFTNLNIICVGHELNSDAITKFGFVSQLMAK